MRENILEVKGLKKYFPIYAGLFRQHVGNIKALDGIDFTIPKGKVLGMLGESGSGKSTAARAAIRLIEPTAGEIFFEGKSLMDLSHNQLRKLRKEIQIVFQDPYASLNPRKTVGENIGEALLYHRIAKTKEEQRDRVADILKKIGLSPDVMQSYPHEFSGGQQQRICIGRAIALNPKLIICDEAVSALDVSLQAQILNLLIELKENHHFSYLFISHDVSVIRYLSDYVTILYLGKIVEQGSAEEVLIYPKHAYTQALLAATPSIYPQRKKPSSYDLYR
jgi:ABC-type oligopeptide transport system ATPase subunit